MAATSRALSCSLLALLLATVALAQGPLIVVDKTGGPGSQAVEISQAIGVAAPGATLLVRAGIYQPFTLGDKTLVIAAEPGANVIVDATSPDGLNVVPAVTVRDVAAGQVVVLEGLQLRGNFGFFEPGSEGLVIENCAGQVWVQDCTVTGLPGPTVKHAGLRVLDSHDVVLTHSTVFGTSYLQPESPASWLGAGLHATGSRVFAFECSFTGGSGGPGALLDDGFLFAERSTLKGGAGVGMPNPIGSNCLLAVNGGVGLQLGGGSPAAIVLDTALVAGPPDFLNGCSQPGAPTSVASGTLQQLPGASIGFSVDSPARDGSTPAIKLTGTPGDMGALLMATSLPPVGYFAKYKGALVTGGPMLFLIGVVPASGTIQVPLHFVDALPSGTGSTIFLQAAVLKAGGGALLGGPEQLTSFDE